MADREEQVTEQTTVTGDAVVTDRAVTTKDRDNEVNKAGQVIWFIIGTLIAILLLRMVLALLGANPANAFANLIYSITNPFISPFRGLLQVGTVELGVARFELETLVAVIVYLLLGWGLVKLISLGKKNAPAV